MYTWVRSQQTSDIMDAFCRFLERSFTVLMCTVSTSYRNKFNPLTPSGATWVQL